jgi:hypothetical protein
MTNPYRLRLQRELDSLVRRKVYLRKLLQTGGLAFSGDWLDRRRGMETAQLELAAAERRHAELRHLLGLPEPCGPVSLTPRPHEAAALARAKAANRGAVKITPTHRTVPDLQAELKRRGFDGRGYLTKDLIPGR